MWETDVFFGVDSTPSLTNRDFGPEERGQNAFARFFGGTCSCHMWLIRVPEHEPAQYSKKNVEFTDGDCSLFEISRLPAVHISGENVKTYL